MKRMFWMAGQHRFATKTEAVKFAKNRRIDAVEKLRMNATAAEIREDSKLGLVDWVRLDRCDQVSVCDVN